MIHPPDNEPGPPSFDEFEPDALTTLRVSSDNFEGPRVETTEAALVGAGLDGYFPWDENSLLMDGSEIPANWDDDRDEDDEDTVYPWDP